jgi:hypothetical protein
LVAIEFGSVDVDAEVEGIALNVVLRVGIAGAGAGAAGVDEPLANVDEPEDGVVSEEEEGCCCC